MASDWGSETDINYPPPEEERLHNPKAHEPHDCAECMMDMRHPLPGNNRSCCTAPVNAYHDSDCAHARWMPLDPDRPISGPPQFVLDSFPPQYHAAIRESWRPGGLPELGLTVRARRNGKSIHYLMEQQRLLQYYAAEQVHVYDDRTEFHAAPFDRDVDATFENEFKLSNETRPH